MNAPKHIKAHHMYAEYDYTYLRNKGYSNREILVFWNRDAERGCKPITKAIEVPEIVALFSQGSK